MVPRYRSATLEEVRTITLRERLSSGRVMSEAMACAHLDCVEHIAHIATALDDRTRVRGEDARLRISGGLIANRCMSMPAAAIDTCDCHVNAIP